MSLSVTSHTFALKGSYAPIFQLTCKFFRGAIEHLVAALKMN